MTTFSSKVLSSVNTFLAAGIFCVGYSLAAQAEDDPFAFDLSEEDSSHAPWQWSGYFEVRGQHFVSDDGWLSRQLLAQLDLKWQHQRWLGYVSGYVSQDSATRDYRDPWRSEVREAYFLYDGGDTDISIGKQRVAWGTADGVSTIDRLNAIDLRDPIGNARTASRRPSWLVRLEQSVGAGILDLVWLPRGKDRKLPEFGNPWETENLNLLRIQAQQGDIDLIISDPHRSEVGLRYLYYGQGLDWSLGYFNGYGDGPERFTQQNTTITLSPVRSRTYNASAALGLARSTLRAELAYTPDAMLDNQRTQLWQAVTGWDRTFFTNLYTNVQIFWNAARNAHDQYGLTFSVSDSFFDDAATSGFRGQLANDDQLALEVYLDYQWGDHIKLGGKVLIFDGNRNSSLGAFKDNDFAEISLRYEF